MAKPLVVDARPTKEFFLYMLTKDIKLIRSLIDLVDNSWDGAIRMKQSVDLSDLSIRIEFDGEKFVISDNCGGIPLKIASDYAFRFGRPADTPQTDHSVGQFGVGMKRTLFKLGKKFSVESTTQECKFTISADIDEWLNNPKWQFEFEKIQNFKRKKPLKECGTKIVVTDLYESVSEDFQSEIFESELSSAIESAHQLSISEGIAVTLNGVSLSAPIAKLKNSGQLKPVNLSLLYDEETDAPINVKLVAGISDSNPLESGWSVFCNGRLVLESDGSLVTGWGEKDQGTNIPRLHNQFARFRGYAFFDCDDASKLPWNTTKTGVDSDSRIYHAVRQKMVELMRPVIDFLNQLDKEKDKEDGDRPLEELVNKAKQKKLSSLPATATFLAPKVEPQKPKKPAERMRRIQYSRVAEQVDLVKDSLGVTTLKEVGELTFDYYLELECE